MSFTAQEHALGPPTSHDVATMAPVMAAVWCRSVGTSWTLELHELGDGTALGTIRDWISSGVPIAQPEPDTLACELLADRGLRLFRNSSAGPCTDNRHGIGYVCRDTELVKLTEPSARRRRPDGGAPGGTSLAVGRRRILRRRRCGVHTPGDSFPTGGRAGGALGARSVQRDTPSGWL